MGQARDANITLFLEVQTLMKKTFLILLALLFPVYGFSQETLPRGTTLFMVKTGDQPAKLIIIQRGQQIELSETELDKAPDSVRPYLESLFRVTPTPLEVTYRIEDSAKDVPGIEEWAQKAAELCREWHPKLEKYLATEGFTPSRKVELVFRKMEGVAFSSRNSIVISSDWVKVRPDDWGMVVHELVHIIQGYRNGNPGWVTEGIADYIRHAQFEPDAPMRSFNPDRAKYTDAYQITAVFFMWLEENKCPDFVQKLNKVMRQGKYEDTFFETTCGANLDTLWAEYIAYVKENNLQSNGGRRR